MLLGRLIGLRLALPLGGAPRVDRWRSSSCSARAAAAAGAPANRANAFVQAVSTYLQFHMNDSQALYKSSSTTGAALKI